VFGEWGVGGDGCGRRCWVDVGGGGEFRELSGWWRPGGGGWGVVVGRGV